MTMRQLSRERIAAPRSARQSTTARCTNWNGIRFTLMRCVKPYSKPNAEPQPAWPAGEHQPEHDHPDRQRGQESLGHEE